MIDPRLEKVCAKYRTRFGTDDSGIAQYMAYRDYLTILTYALDSGEITLSDAVLEARLGGEA